MHIDDLSAALSNWEQRIESVEKLAGGWNSSVWLVRSESGVRYVAKLADTHDADAFRGGLRSAALAASHGFPSGPPVPTRDGRIAMKLAEGFLALLEYIPGRTGDASSEEDVRRMGATLARAHQALQDDTGGMSEQFIWPWRWADACLENLTMPEEVQSAAVRVLDRAREISSDVPIRIGVVHGDPGLDSFRLHDESPLRDGLIDWSATMEAPILYDLGSFAVMTRGAPQMLQYFLSGYLEVTPELSDEVKYLDAFIKLRWMCNAIYFSARISRGIVRGVNSAADNERGLMEAYAGMVR
ncbi:phosphotransferase [Streptomyces sp. NBS 14/10]|uniref:phosphotransferase enzyme family protein n=1 Tax=Streptomyces sp. NBS 14/10 TaxID=1945643 RepID=UPI000B7EEBFA|nr:phosphotransferase [Streptomyces sp. NBS 14/10]KAK1184378.1 phosphotransferase [Streptomyces sp. NBS 14/10]